MGYGEFLVDPSWGNSGAADTYGKISRAQWNDYKARFVPIEDKLIESIGNEQLLGEQISRNVNSVNLGFSSAKVGSDQKMRMYGTQLTGEQKNASNRQTNLSQNLATIDAKNLTRLAKKERDMQSMAGSVSTSAQVNTGNTNV
ncbi:hypothetical protein A9Q81_11630 [Gammaproteobacteria bacterium 42_54_T18]|nr:hypothetical protein A9Q81_11630 [Gammaproteobacteria bacterium 42_54_T18]